jgi:hypothetical protein
MASCAYKAVCPFAQGKIPIHEAMFKTNTTKYCEGSSVTCAIYEVIAKSSFLKVPKDLYPNQTFRVKQIVGG